MLSEARTFGLFFAALLRKEGLSEDGYANLLKWHSIPNRRMTPGLDWKWGFEAYPNHEMGYAVFTNSNTGEKFYDALRVFLVTGRDAAPGTEFGPDFGR